MTAAPRPPRPSRALLRAYPPRFRARYGEEMSALLAEGGGGWRLHADLARGALRAWVDPCFAGGAAEQRRARLQATTTTVLVAWCASLLAAGGFSKAVDDPRLPGLHGAAWAAYDTGALTLEALAGAVLVAGFGCWLVVVVPAARRRRRDVLVPAVAPAPIVVGWLGVTALVAVFAHHVVGRHPVALTWPHGAVVLLVLVAWGLVTVACAFGCAAAAALALRRAGLSDEGLARTAVVAVVAGAGVAVQAVAAVVCLALVLRRGGGLATRDVVFSTTSVAVLVVATACAVVSGVRGVAALGQRVPTRSSTPPAKAA